MNAQISIIIPTLNEVDNIKAINIGFSNEVGEFTFYCDPNLTVNASLNNVNDNSNAIKIICKVDVLDRFVMSNFINKIDFSQVVAKTEMFGDIGYPTDEELIDFATNFRMCRHL